MGDPPTAADRESGYTSDYENLRPGAEGEPPRPANEPTGAKASEQSSKLATDPGSGLSTGEDQAPNQGPDMA